MNFQTMNKQRKFILIAALAGIISMFLPWVSISMFGYTQSVNGMHGNGILVFLCFAASGVIAYLGDQTKNLEKTMWTVTLIAGALAALVVLWNIIDASGNPLGNFLGIGIYFSALAAIGVLLATFLFRSSTDSLKGGFDSLKNDIESKIKSTSVSTNVVNTTTSRNLNNSAYIATNQNTEPTLNSGNMTTGTDTDMERTGDNLSNTNTSPASTRDTTDSNLPI